MVIKLTASQGNQLFNILDKVRGEARDAYAEAVKKHPHFTLRDFGVPQITAIMVELYDAMEASEQKHASDLPMTVLGVPGRLTHRTTMPGRPRHLFFKQRWVSEGRPIAGHGDGAALRVTVSFDDPRGDGHNTFSITAQVKRPKKRDFEAGGCMHEKIAKLFPELGGLIKWHLCSTDGPMHYPANTVYLAGNRDHTGRAIGEPSAEFCQIPTVFSAGKHRELGKARATAAIWLDASDEELCQEPEILTAALQARLPALLAEFREVVERIGFLWTAE